MNKREEGASKLEILDNHHSLCNDKYASKCVLPFSVFTQPSFFFENWTKYRKWDILFCSCLIGWVKGIDLQNLTLTDIYTD